jgi:hypothetical protein
MEINIFMKGRSGRVKKGMTGVLPVCTVSYTGKEKVDYEKRGKREKSSRTSAEISVGCITIRGVGRMRSALLKSPRSAERLLQKLQIHRRCGIYPNPVSMSVGGERNDTE